MFAKWFLLIALSAPGESPRLPDAPDPLPLRTAFLEGALWDDGKAEVSEYRSERIVYGKVRQFQTTLIVVKESFGTVSRVKRDTSHPRDPEVEAIKLNLLQTIPTENYPYHYMITMLAERRDPFALLKESVSSHDWCGTTYQQVGHKGGAWQYWWDSYWENEAHDFRILSGRPVTEEQLLWALRGVAWKPGLEGQLPVIWGLHAHRAKGSEPRASRVVCRGETSMNGNDVRAFEIAVTPTGDREPRARFWIGVEAPHPLLRYEGTQGRKLELVATRRWAYWQRGN